MGYIKSHSNYVIKKHHQLTNDGTIYERDITTIGGLNQFAKGQIPIYQSGNFIITVNNDSSYVKDYTNNNWEKNSENEIWTLTNISGLTNDNNETFEVLKQDYYSLRDFAYYGSCSELIRASITDIINRFPGEMYGPIMGKNEDGENFGINMFYTDEYGNETTLYKEDGWYLLDNPFNIDIYTKKINKNDIIDELKYFCNGGYKNYLIYNDDDNKFDEENEENYVITNYSVESYECGKPSNGGSTSEDIKVIAKVTLTSAKATINIVALKGDNGSIVYLTDSNGLGYHIRPKNSFYEKFIKSLDSFQTVLLNTESKPKYSVLFEIIRENSFGYYTEMKRFTFPTTFGKYNLSVNDPAYSTYINDLADIANYYDENFSDNLYRSMCHEAIKNFDWSYSREYSDGDSDEYIFGGTRIQNVLRLIAREFDEIKYYIDEIGNANILSYNNTMPNNILNNMLVNDGWDVTSVIPFKKEEKNEPTSNSNGFFIRYNDLEINPYSSSGGCFINGYFINFCYKDKNDCILTAYLQPCKSDDEMYKVENSVLKTKIKQYFSEIKYTMDDVNNLFMKVLKLNSRQILRHKGTVEGIEMILSLFGLKSKKWYDKKLINEQKQRIFSPYNLEQCDIINDNEKNCECEKNATENCNVDDSGYDYEIKEYVCVVNPLIDKKYDTSEYQIDMYNQTKTITYDTDDYRNGIYNEYQGLPVKYYDIVDDEGNNTRYLVPYFDKNKIIDGNPYYQMNGGWLWKNIQFNKNDKEVYEDYTETLKNIPSVNNLKELFSIPYNELTNGAIYKVKDLSINYIIIDGVVYNLYNEVISNQENYYYFNVTISNNSIKIGQQLFIDSVLVSSPYGAKNTVNGVEVTEELYDFNNYNNGDDIRIYLIDNKCYARESYMLDIMFLNCVIFIDGNIQNIKDNTEETQNDNEKTKTNYFQITDRNYKNILINCINCDEDGWKQLDEDDLELKKIDNLENYFNGNNPHTGNMKYDNGLEYLSYFKKLFKYAIENEEFDLRCYYNQTMNDVINTVSQFGFEFRKDNNEEEFCYEKIYSDVISKDDSTSNDEQDENSIEINYPEQIINTKRVDIIFHILENNDLNALNKSDLIKIKYYDDVIIKYLSQMIPHNAIVKIIYDKKLKNDG